MPVRTTTMEGTLSAAVATPRFRTTLVSGFAALALLLAIGGVYGVMAYLVSRRTSEIGVRMAMGATPMDIQRLVVGQGMRLAMGGIATGSVLAYVLAKSLRGMLFGVTPTDPLVFALAALVLLITAAAATAIPAMRAAWLDPIAALRAD
jgi:ABC-type antimicrobial peptide transport system permease subunit